MNAGLGVVACVSITVATIACATQPTHEGLSSEALIGSWRLISEEARSSTGRITYQYGRPPAGRLMYDAAGRMSVHLVDPAIPQFSSGDPYVFSPDEVNAAFTRYFGYFGTYTVDSQGGTVTHHVLGASYPNYTGTHQTRFAKLSGDRLELSTPPQQEGGEELRTYLVWEREH